VPPARPAVCGPPRTEASDASRDAPCATRSRVAGASSGHAFPLLDPFGGGAPEEAGASSGHAVTSVSPRTPAFAGGSAGGSVAAEDDCGGNVTADEGAGGSVIAEPNAGGSVAAEDDTGGSVAADDDTGGSVAAVDEGGACRAACGVAHAGDIAGGGVSSGAGGSVATLASPVRGRAGASPDALTGNATFTPHSAQYFARGVSSKPQARQRFGIASRFAPGRRARETLQPGPALANAR
jgi:hypothetical protein